MAKVSQSEAKKTALAIHPGKVMSSEYEIGFDGSVTYEFDILSEHGYEIKVDVDTITGLKSRKPILNSTKLVQNLKSNS